MSFPRLTYIIFLLVAHITSHAQQEKSIQSIAGTVQTAVNDTISKPIKKIDSTITAIQRIPSRYFKEVNNKIDKYNKRLTSKTEKTLAKLSRWENKIKKLLDKASPETSAKLFANNQLTFSAMLAKLQQGQNFISATEARYDNYRDKLNTSIKYLQSQKDKLDSSLLAKTAKTSSKLNNLDQDIANSEQLEKLIKERKKQLLDEAVKYIGKSKYLAKINKESYYYAETLRNYKELFSDTEKAEQTALTILNKLPAFQKFMSQNSMLASLFGSSGNYNTVAEVAGLQTRTSINDLIQNKIISGGPNAKETMQAAMQQAQGEMNKLKDKVMQSGGSGNADDMPNFKPNKQKTKTFFQRLEYSSNYQLNKSTSSQPMIADLALGVGYKLNDKGSVGIGAAYKLGLGKIDRVKISGQGIGFRSYVDWQLKKQFFISGGFEMNYNTAFKNLSELQLAADSWQQSALLGISKKLGISTKFFKATNVQLMYDFLYKQHLPESQPVVFRVGYSFR